MLPLWLMASSDDSNRLCGITIPTIYKDYLLRPFNLQDHIYFCDVVKGRDCKFMIQETKSYTRFVQDRGALLQESCVDPGVKSRVVATGCKLVGKRVGVLPG